MGSFVEAARVSDLGDGVKKRIMLEGHEVLLAKVDGKYYAADNLCPHMNGDLSQGKLEGTIITCPRHASQFDLKDGSVVRWLKGSGALSRIGRALKSSHPLTTYKVAVEDDSILIEI